MQGIVPGEETNGWKLYWLGHTPETAETPDETLVFLMVNEETDEVDAFRTSLSMLANHENPIDVSLMIFRDSASDAREEERYNVLVFDTPAGEESLFKVVTNVLNGNEMVLPRPLRVVLRAFKLDETRLPVYCLNGIANVLVDGTHGGVSLFDGEYWNTFDGSTFESEYMKIERNDQGGMDVTLRQGQPVWPEWTDTDSAETIGGDRFIRVNGTWGQEVPVISSLLPAD